jgi:hypothetical protein
MTEKEFYPFLAGLRELAQVHTFRVNHHYYSPAHFGNYTISISNGISTCRLNHRRGQLFIEVKKNKSWEKMSDYVGKYFNGTALHSELAASGLYQHDFSVASNLQFLPKLLQLLKESGHADANSPQS